MAVLIPGLADAEILGVWLSVDQARTGSRELGDIAIDELHLESSEVFGVWHFVGMLNYQVSIRVWLAHH